MTSSPLPAVAEFTRSAIVQPAAQQAAHDAEQFGKVLQRNWEGGLLVARSVRKATNRFDSGEYSPLSKLSLRAFATEAGVHHSTVAAYLKAWERAAADGLVPEAASLEPGQDVDLPTSGWDAYYGGKSAAELLVASDENEWYTPAAYIEAARDVLGGIDLDPASSAAANETVRATKFYSAADDGLEQPWHGRVWLNPPYGRLAGAFVGRLCAAFLTGEISSAIALVNAHCTDTGWFQPLWDSRLCFTDHRIDFDSAGRDKNTTSTHGSVFSYLGPDPEAFTQRFTEFGAVVTRA